MKFMKWVRRILALLVLLAAVGFGIFWVSRRQAQTATPIPLDDLTPLSVSLLPDDTCAAAAQEMVEQLPNSPIIARVSAASSPMSCGSAMIQRFYVNEVYAGEGLEEHALIWLTSAQWNILRDREPPGLQSGYVNLPQNNWEYLVFLAQAEEELPTVDGYPIYQLRDDLTLTPILCCVDWNAQVEERRGSTMLFQKAQWQEFFTQTQQGMDVLMEAKHTVMARYPAGE